MIPRNARSLVLMLALTGAATAPFFACAAPEESEEDGEASEDAVTGASNPLGLRLTYDRESNRVSATLKDSLKSGEQLRLRVRRGAATLTSQKELKCDDLPRATAQQSRDLANVGKVIYRTNQSIDSNMLDLLKVYDDHRWQSDPAWAAQRTREINAAGGPKVLVEACITNGDKVRAKLQTTLEYAWDLGKDDEAQAKTLSLGGGSLGIRADGGAGDAGPAGPVENAEAAISSMEKYGEKCVEELGEIPFFKKLANGKYDTFDCRDFKGTGEGHDPQSMAGVEGSLIPLTVDGAAREKCDGEGPNGQKSGSGYNCVSKCDRAEFLSEGCEPGPTVTTAKNDKGTHWVLLCRKVAGGEDKGWLKTKKFDDIAMIGSNPKTGKTCFFQNNIGSGTDGEHVPHPADVEKSRTLWDSPKGYCFQSCHSTDAFIQSPWINNARKSNNKPVVPMMGFDPDFEISWLESPYYVVNMDAQGWTIPKQLVSEEAGPCISCHRAGGDSWIREFANWTTGNNTGGGAITENDSYWGKITSTGQSFEKAHWMPMRLDGITAETWAGSKWQKAVDHLNKCNSNSSDPSCVWADVPRGEGNPVRPNR
jgi:hypothetical protein